jgi:uncharacterized damage-inducible protein DinB
MANAAVRELVTALEAAYRGDTEHSILGSLWTVRDEEWASKLSPDGRSVREIARHVAAGKLAYYAAAFGDGTQSWDAAAAAAESKASREDLMAFMDERHAELVRAVSALDDQDLDAPRAAHWGELVPTRRILLVLIGHDYYHSGEINHLRSVLQGNDRWGYYVDEMPAREALWGAPEG